MSGLLLSSVWVQNTAPHSSVTPPVTLPCRTVNSHLLFRSRNGAEGQTKPDHQAGDHQHLTPHAFYWVVPDFSHVCWGDSEIIKNKLPYKSQTNGMAVPGSPSPGAGLRHSSLPKPNSQDSFESSESELRRREGAEHRNAAAAKKTRVLFLIRAQTNQ